MPPGRDAASGRFVSASGGGGQSIGHAEFTVIADTSGFEPALKQAESTARQASDNIGRSMGRGSNAAMGMLYLGQAADDLQYGFRSIVNNIPQLVMAMGGGVGLAGVVGVAAVAVNQLMNHWGDLIAAFDGGATKRQAEEMAVLAEHTKAAAKEYERLKAARTGPGEESVGATSKAIVGIGAEGLAEGIAKALEREFPMPDEVATRGEVDPETGMRGPDVVTKLEPGTPAWRAHRDAFLEEKRKSGELMAGDMNNPETRNNVTWLAEKHPDDFPPDVARKLKEASPGALAEKAVAERKVKEADEKARADEKAVDRKAREMEGERKATDALNAAKKEAAANLKKEILKKAEINKAGRVQKIDDEEKTLHKRQETIRESMQDRPSMAIHGSWQSKIDSMTTERFNRIPTEQLDELKSIKKQLEKLNDAKREIQGAKFG